MIRSIALSLALALLGCAYGAHAEDSLKLKISPSNAPLGSQAALEVDLLADAAHAGEALASAGVNDALKALASGEYEIVVAGPGYAYVGTVIVLQAADGCADEALLRHSSGMEIDAADYIEAISQQASNSGQGAGINL